MAIVVLNAGLVMSPRLLVAILVVLHALMLSWGILTYGPTVDEVAHLPAGLSNLETGRFPVYHVNPPLVRLLAAFPVHLMSPVTDWSQAVPNGSQRTEFRLGAKFIHDNAVDFRLYFIVARFACVPFSILGLLVCVRWAREIFGPRASAVAGLLWAGSPMVVGHGGLITPDVATAALGLVAIYAMRHWVLHPGLGSSVLLGCACGVALLSKFTWAVALPITGSIVFTGVLFAERQGLRWPRSLQGLLAVVVSLVVVNLGYGFEGSFTKLGDYEFHSLAFKGESEPAGRHHQTDRPRSDPGNRFRDSPLGLLPIPLPYHYLKGIDTQRIDFEPGTNHGSYLAGSRQHTGWWYYYFVAALLKVPLPILCLYVLSLSQLCTRRKPDSTDHWGHATLRVEYGLLILPALTLGLVLSSQHSFTDHFRYALPAFPFVFILASGVVRPQINLSIQRLALGLAIAQIGSCLMVGPNWIGYFNSIGGGSRSGYLWLAGSNVDWGQDLPQLRAWQVSHPKRRPLYFAGTAPYRLSDLGIEASLPKQCLTSDRSPEGLGDGTSRVIGGYRSQASANDTSSLPAGWHAVSVQALTGSAFSMYDQDGNKVSFSDEFTEYRSLTPVEWIGDSIVVFFVPERQNAEPKVE